MMRSRVLWSHVEADFLGKVSAPSSQIRKEDKEVQETFQHSRSPFQHFRTSEEPVDGQAVGPLCPESFGAAPTNSRQLLLARPAWEGAMFQMAARLVPSCQPIPGTCFLSRPASVWTK